MTPSSGASLIERPARLMLLFAVVPALLALGVIWRPLPTAVISGACIASALSLLAARTSSKFLGTLLGLLLVGYAFGGKSFAYLGSPPLYVGEGVLGLTLLGCLGTGIFWRPLRSRTAWLLLAFAVWCACQTVTHLPQYGFDSLRDAALWGYGTFALIVSGLLLNHGAVHRVVTWYRKLIGVYMAWVLGTFALGFFAYRESVSAAGDGPDLLIKGGDAAVHLAGIACFMVFGLHRLRVRNTPHGGLREWWLWLIWAVGFVLFGSQTRGGLLSMLVALAVAFIIRPSGKWGKLAVVGMVSLAAFAALDLQVDVGRVRKATPQQILSGLASLGGGDDPSYEGTRRWRLQWWQAIVNYTVYGDYFWRGKGFGVNLADDDGFQVDPQHRLRSPHNGHLTVLARAGVPGVALWLLLQGSFLVGLVREYYKARRAAETERAAVIGWVLSYWAAFIVNAAFDVFLEGPHGGIWFWSLFGVGLALLADRALLKRESVQRDGHLLRCQIR